MHETVLLDDAIEELQIKKGDVVVDATLGGGGHSTAILKKISSEGKLISIDRDIEAIRKFESSLGDRSDNIFLINRNFGDLKDILDDLKIKKVNAILADFGLSSDQLDNAERGFSFSRESRLDMRMDQNQELSAYEVINEYSEERLEEIIRIFGDERFSRRIASNIVQSREEGDIETTVDLAHIIEGAIPKKFLRKGINPATKTFQAIRIEVNDELKSIDAFVREAIDRLDSGGRLAVISFHSGEDRIVKNIFKESSRGCVCPQEFPKCNCQNEPKIKLISRKPIIPSEEEMLNNPRSRSAKMRVIEKI